MYAGDMGREMYCVRRGLVEVIGDDDCTVVATLGPGAYFGEVFIVAIPFLIATSEESASVCFNLFLLCWLRCSNRKWWSRHSDFVCDQ